VGVRLNDGRKARHVQHADADKKARKASDLQRCSESGLGGLPDMVPIPETITGHEPGLSLGSSTVTAGVTAHPRRR